MPKDSKEIFISYAWGGDSEELVNRLDQAFQTKGITIIRDKRDLGYKGLIKDFMERIGRGKCVVAVISDKYLKSPNCMFELVQVAKNGEFYDRIFPIILADAQIYDPVQRVKYIKYWEDKKKELDKAIKEVGSENLQGIREEIDQYTEIRNTIAKLTDALKNMNTLTRDIHSRSDFQVLLKSIELKLSEDSSGIDKAIDDEVLNRIIDGIVGTSETNQPDDSSQFQPEQEGKQIVDAKPPEVVRKNSTVKLVTDDGRYMASAYSGLRYYCAFLGSEAMPHRLGGNGEPLVHKSNIPIITTEKFKDTIFGKWSNRIYLGAFGDADILYYWAQYGSKSNWIIEKVNATQGSEIHYGDEVYIKNEAYQDQYLQPAKNNYVTTRKNEKYKWRILKLE